MKGRHQRRALAAQGDILASEISDHGDAGFGRNDVRVADLQGKRRGRTRPVTDGLTVTADCPNLGCRHIRLG